MGLIAVAPTEVLIAIGALATAVITAGILRVTLRGHALDKATSGTQGALHVTGVRQDWRPEKEAFDQFPQGWSKANTRYFGLRIHNRGPYDTRAFVHAEDLRVGWRREKVDTQGVLTTEGPLKTHEPVPLVILMHKAAGWKTARFVRKRVRLTIQTNLDTVRFRKRVWVKPIPEPGSGSWAAAPMPSEPTAQVVTPQSPGDKSNDDPRPGR